MEKTKQIIPTFIGMSILIQNVTFEMSIFVLSKYTYIKHFSLNQEITSKTLSAYSYVNLHRGIVTAVIFTNRTLHC